MDLSVGGLIDHSTLDYPEELVSVIALCNCTFECPFCQNWKLVRGEDCTNVKIEDIVKRMVRNRSYITGICVTGGEPTVQIEGIIELFKQTHELKLLNKLDTNGYFPKRIEKILSFKILDYVALDIKAPLIPEKYGKMIGKPVLGAPAVERVVKTLKILGQASIAFETRTTVIPSINDTEEEIGQIANMLKKFNVPRYVLQQFLPSSGTLNEEFSVLPATEHDLLAQLGRTAKKFLSDVRIRTIEGGYEKILD